MITNQCEGIGGQVPLLHDPEANRSAYPSLSKAIHAGLVVSAHDCSDGGLAVTLVEMCIGGRIGAEVELSQVGEASLWSRLYGESLARIVLAIRPEVEETFVEAMKSHPCRRIGNSTSSDSLIIREVGETLLEVDIEEAAKVWKSTFSGGEI